MGTNLRSRLSESPGTRHFSPFDHRQFTKRENGPHGSAGSPAMDGQKVPRQISGLGGAWYSGFAIQLTNSSLREAVARISGI